jgi:hypothetical protein
LEPAARLLAFKGVEELARHRGRMVWLLAERLTDLELRVEDLGDQLREAGYEQLVDNDSGALHVALINAEARRACDVIAVHEHLFDDEDIRTRVRRACTNLVRALPARLVRTRRRPRGRRRTPRASQGRGGGTFRVRWMDIGWPLTAEVSGQGMSRRCGRHRPRGVS